MGDVWVPKTKAELIEWLSGRWPEQRKKFKSKTKRNLYAIYYSVVRDVRAKVVLREEHI